jgi:hypothetical protein
VNRKISIALFVLAAILFLLPFADLSCSGTKVVSVTGVDLVIGKQVDNSSYGGSSSENAIDPQPLAIVALVAAVAGVVSGFIWKRKAIARVILGVAGAALLIALKFKLDGDISREGQGYLQISYQFGYWAAIIVFVAAAAVNFLKKEISLKLGTEAEVNPQNSQKPPTDISSPSS